MNRTQAATRQQSLDLAFREPTPQPPARTAVSRFTLKGDVYLGHKALGLGTWGLAALEKGES